MSLKINQSHLESQGRIKPAKSGKFGSRAQAQQAIHQKVLDCLQQIATLDYFIAVFQNSPCPTFAESPLQSVQNFICHSFKLPRLSALKVFVKMQSDPRYLQHQQMIEQVKQKYCKLVMQAENQDFEGALQKDEVTFDY